MEPLLPPFWADALAGWRGRLPWWVRVTVPARRDETGTPDGKRDDQSEETS